MGCAIAPFILLINYAGIVTVLVIEGDYGRGDLLFVTAFTMTCVVLPFLLYYAIAQSCCGILNQTVALFIPVVALLTSTWLAFMGILKLFLDELHVDVIEMISNKFEVRDHVLSWSMALIYLVTVFQGLKAFHRHSSLHEEQKFNNINTNANISTIEQEGEKNKNTGEEVAKKNDVGVVKLFLSQLAMSVIFLLLEWIILQQRMHVHFVLTDVQNL